MYGLSRCTGTLTACKNPVYSIFATSLCGKYASSSNGFTGLEYELFDCHRFELETAVFNIVIKICGDLNYVAHCEIIQF